VNDVMHIQVLGYKLWWRLNGRPCGNESVVSAGEIHRFIWSTHTAPVLIYTAYNTVVLLTAVVVVTGWCYWVLWFSVSE